MLAPSPQFLVLQYITLEDINHLCLFVYMVTVCIHIVQMDVSMQKVLGLEPLHEGQECRKTLMTTIGVVTEAQRGCVGDQNVYIPSMKHSIEQKSGCHLEHSEKHFLLGELMLALVVAHRTAQAGNDEVLLAVVEHLSVDVVSTEAGKHLHFSVGVSILHDRLGIRGELMKELKVMVAEHKEKRFVQAGDDELIVLERKIARCNDDIDVCIP